MAELPPAARTSLAVAMERQRILRYIDQKLAYWTGYAEGKRQSFNDVDATTVLVVLDDLREFVHGSTPQETHLGDETGGD